MKNIGFKLPVFLICIMVIVSACSKNSRNSNVSKTTGWAYNDPQTGSMPKNDYYMDHDGGPGLLFIEGGAFTMGATEDDVMGDWNNMPRTVTVSSFFMDETEVSNLDYLEYLYWLKKVYNTNGQSEVFLRALPDTNVWRERMAYNEPLVNTYLRHPAFRDYPVVGVSWRQANDYCLWRSDRVNEMRLAQLGIIKIDPNPTPETVFTTDSYLAGGSSTDGMGIPTANKGEYRKASIEDGVILPNYRLPTEAEWEYAAVGLIGNTADNGFVLSRRTYPWNGNQTRSYAKKSMGMYYDNYNDARGNSMGNAGNLNDGYAITAPVYSFFPNDFGLYHMAGNVSEWTLDTYRQLSFEDFAENNPFRGNVFSTPMLDANGNKVLDANRRVEYIPVDSINDPKLINRYNYRRADYNNFNDGDNQSLADSDETKWKKDGDAGSTEDMYRFSLINDNSKVYKGGSWKDGAYYLSPGERRFYDADGSTDFIGFRCAMNKIGSSR